MLKHCYLHGMDIRYDDEHNSVVLNNCIVRLSHNQYTLLALLLAQQEVRDDDLSLALYAHTADDEHRDLLTRTVAKVRLKINPHGLTIRRVYGQGYRLETLNNESMSFPPRK